MGRTARRRRLVPNSHAKAGTILERVTWLFAGNCDRPTLVKALNSNSSLAMLGLKMLLYNCDEISKSEVWSTLPSSQSYTDDVDIFTRAIRPQPFAPRTRATVACSVEKTNKVRTLTTKTRQHLSFSQSSIHLSLSSEPTRRVLQTPDGTSLLRGFHALALIWSDMTSSLNPCLQARARTSSKFLR